MLLSQGVYKRALQGNASAENAEGVGALAKSMADMSWDFMQKHRDAKASSFSSAATPGRSSWPAPVFAAPSMAVEQAHAQVREFVNEEVWWQRACVAEPSTGADVSRSGRRLSPLSSQC